MLRDALGVLERRRRYAGAARAAATLGELLRERGQTQRAGVAMRQARLLFEAVESVDTSGVDDTEDGRSDGGALPEAEQEDYLEARSLLSSSSVEGDTAARRGGMDRSLVELASDCAALLGETASVVETEALQRVCRWLRSRFSARSVAVYGFTEGSTLLASAGDVDRHVDETIRSLANVATQTTACPDEDEPMLRATGDGRGSIAVAPVRDGGRTIGAVSMQWARAPTVPDRAVYMIRVAATLCKRDLSDLVQGVREVESIAGSGGLIGQSPEMTTVRESIRRAAVASYPVLIEGETGVGKELVAKAVHHLGPRQKQMFCPVNCAALTDELFEAELFGHARGAFTGAVGDRVGLVEAANRGTLFLDEVGELSGRAQAKLLRVVQEGEVRRVGENIVRRVDVQLVAATNRELSAEVEAGRFRQDLLFRLAVVCLQVPPLRMREGDVELLARHFWDKAMTRTGKRATLTSDVLQVLSHYRWPGNVRELQNVVARLAVFAPRRGAVSVAMLPSQMLERVQERSATLAEARQQFERRYVKAAMRRSGGRPTVAARELGISRQGLAKLRVRLAAD